MACNRSNITMSRPICCCPTTSSCECSKKNGYIELKRELLHLREDIQKKDSTIRDLCNMSAGVPPPRPPLEQDIRARTSTIQVHQDVIDDRIRRMQADLDSKFETINNLRREIDLLRRENVKLQEDLRDSQNRLQETAGSKAHLESVQSRHDVAYQALQDRYTAAQDKIQQLEENILNHLRTRDKVEFEKSSFEQQYTTLLTRLSTITAHADITDMNAILCKVQTMSLEHSSLTSQVAVLEADKVRLEEELQAAKDAITNANTRGRDSQSSIRSAIRAELDVKIQLLESKLENVEGLFASTSEERDALKARVEELECELDNKTGDRELCSSQYTGLLESLSEMLTNCVTPLPCDPEEGKIKERLRQLISELKIKTVTVESLQQRLQNLGGVLKQHVEVDHSMTHLSSDELNKLRQRVRELEFELSSKNVLTSGFSGEKERVLKRLKNLAIDIGMTHIETCGLDELIDRLQSHYQSMEYDVKASSCQYCCNTVCCCAQPIVTQQCTCQDQTMLTSLRSKLASKEEQLSRLRSHVNQLESDLRTSKLHVSNELSRREHLGDIESRKLRRSLGDAEAEICRLKQELLQSKEAMVTMIDKNMEMQDLNKSVDKLERVRQLQAQKIAGLRSQVHTKEHSEVNALDEARKLVEELRQNERKYTEFRNRVCRQLNIDPNSVNPSAEAQILEYLSKTTATNNNGGSNCCCGTGMTGTPGKSRGELLDADMQPGFGMRLPPRAKSQQSYPLFQNSGMGTNHSYTKSSFTNGSLRRSQTSPQRIVRRQRSMSPEVRLDHRKY